MNIGYLDSNVVVHSITRDAHSPRCRAFLLALREGSITAILDPLVVHELTYVLPRYAKQMTRLDIAAFLTSMLEWPGIEADGQTLADALRRWSGSTEIGFVDALLAARAVRSGARIFSINVRHFAGHGVDVPDPLPIE